VVPAATVAREAEQLLTRAGQPAADLRVEVQELAPATSRATGATTGLIVSWVARSGPAHGVIVPGDVIESADGQPFPTVDHWQRYVSRLVVGSPTSLRIRRRGEVREVTVTPAPTAPPESAGAPRAARTRIGLVMRFIPGSGSEVTAVEPESIGAAAGLEPGDVITWIGSLSSPEPLQIRQTTTAAEPGRPLLVGIQRGTRHRVTTFER
jgi:serine protease DegQ